MYKCCRKNRSKVYRPTLMWFHRSSEELRLNLKANPSGVVTDHHITTVWPRIAGSTGCFFCFLAPIYGEIILYNFRTSLPNSLSCWHDKFLQFRVARLLRRFFGEGANAVSPPVRQSQTSNYSNPVIATILVKCIHSIPQGPLVLSLIRFQSPNHLHTPDTIVNIIILCQRRSAESVPQVVQYLRQASKCFL